MDHEAPRSRRAPSESDPFRSLEGSDEDLSTVGPSFVSGHEGRPANSEASDTAEDPSTVSMRGPRVGRLVVGVGNPFRGDDGAGRAVARLIASGNDGGLVACECTGEATSLMSLWTGFDDVVVVDACRGAGPPGSVHRFGPDDVDRVATLENASTHSLGVAAAIGLARAVGTLPSRLVIYAIEARDSRESEGLSPEVDHGVQQVVALVMQGSQV
jgi:hydrogenase maturation protease